MKIFLIIAGAMALVGMLPLDSGYYSVLRLVLAGAGIVVLVTAMKSKSVGWALLGGFMFVLWFPLFQVYMDRSVWVPLDLIAGISLIAYSRKQH